mmetsp:Transcript_177771/g.569996  ORF Transcript_177771/g.569996 Transcript_177771/m.569996 type:complete len:1721 (-) Transcript_177771:250-5412(-)
MTPGGKNVEKVGFTLPEPASRPSYQGSALKAIKSHLPIYTPDKHNVPTHIMIAITVTIAALVAVTNWAMVEVEVRLVAFKFDNFEKVMSETGLLAGTLVLMGCAVLYSGIAACIVFFIAPICAGSGLPEAKGYLNGNRIPGMFVKTNFLVRTVGIVLATASGFPVGREGPMVCIGGCIGIAVVDLLAQPYVQDWVKLDAGSDMSALVVHEKRFAAAKRVGCVLGAAAGIAVAFNAPVGGVLYMFEEVTVNGWPSELTFRAFIVVAIASFASRFLLLMMGSDVHRLLIYEENYHGSRDWDWADIPFIVALAAICGLASALFSKVLAEVWSLRRAFVLKLGKRSYLKIVEVMLYAAFCALVFSIAPMLISCTDSSHGGGDAVDGHAVASHSSGAGASLHGGTSAASLHTGGNDDDVGDAHGRRLSSLAYAQYTCGEGHYNEVATLLLGTAEGAVKHLFSRNSEDLSLGALLVAFLTYFTLALGMPGLSVPMGMFVPNLLLGALMGRFAGEAVNSRISTGMAHPGVYAMVGSAAMLGGFTHMTIAIVVLLVEAAQDLSIVSPLMLGVFVAHFASKAVSHEGYDELIIKRKGVPFLDAETVHEMGHTSIDAGMLCKTMPMPEGAILSPEASIEDVERALQVSSLYDFPVVEDGICMGLVERSHLEAALEAVTGVPDIAPIENAPAVIGRERAGTPASKSGTRPRSFTVASARDRSFTVTFTEERLSHDESYTDMAHYKDVHERGDHTRRVAKERILTEVGNARERIRTMTCCDLDTLVEVHKSETHRTPSSEAIELGLDKVSIPLHRIMDTTPHVLLEDMPMTRFYPLFTTSGCHAACVISADGAFKGVLSRAHLIAAVHAQHNRGHRSAHLPQAVPAIQYRDSSSRVSLTQPRTHGIPALTLWAITVLIAILVALTNIGMVLIDLQIVGWKYKTMQNTLTENGILLGALVFMAICVVLAFMAACVVSYIAPICAGSGIPEAKGYMNGNYVQGMFEPPNYFVRAFGIVMSTAAGFPVGREGPMVCIGGIVGVAVVHRLAIKHVQMLVEVNKLSDNHTLVVEEERFRHAKRIGCVLGAAAGIATAFAAPVGAILYMIEEVSVDSWPQELTLRTFVCTAVAVLMSRATLNLMHTDVHRLLIYDNKLAEAKQWFWADVPFFILVAVICGLCSAGLTRVFVAAWSRRNVRNQKWQQKGWQPYGKITECCGYAALCALAFFLVPALSSCIEEVHGAVGALGDAAEHGSASSALSAASGASGGHRLLSEASHGLNRVRYTCPEGSYNEVASLLLSGAEGAVKHLFARDGAEKFSLGSLFLTLFTYLPLAGGMPGLPVPMGAFVPSMLTGGLIGRIVGEAISGLDIGHAGIYSMVGSAAMLGGFTHMTLAIVVLLVEASQDLSLVSPLILAVIVARVVSKRINHHGYDEILILKKGVAFLDSKCPAEMNDLKVSDICTKVPCKAHLRLLATEQAVKRALEASDVVHFPVFESGTCIGLVARARLQEVVQAREQFQRQAAGRGETVAQRVATFAAKRRDSHHENKCRFAGDHGGATPGLKMGKTISDRAAAADVMEDWIPIRDLMDPAPYTLLDDLLVVRAYPLFTKAGLTAACVMTRKGEFVGTLARANLMSSRGKRIGEPMTKSRSGFSDVEDYEFEDRSLDVESIDVDVDGDGGVAKPTPNMKFQDTRRPRKDSRAVTVGGAAEPRRGGLARLFCLCFPSLGGFGVPTS